MPRTRIPTASPLETLVIGRRRIKVGDELTLRLKVQRIGPYGRGEDRPGITIMLPDGHIHTIAPELLGERE
jgi:hypothetical protein